jgi:saccharopine dehydrogenase-like NADP-dependent oxidoreductase
MHRVLVLGGYGFFGSRICTALARNPAIHLVIAGRDLAKATALAYQLGLTAAHARSVDAASPQLAPALRKLQVNTLIHTAGPFQEQNYAVAQACIQAGCNYLDLADGRRFVGGIVKLDAAARAANVCVVSGVSSLPALSSAVVDRHAGEYSRLDAIRVGITSGALVPGIATVRAVFSYCGQPFTVLEKGERITVRGWVDSLSYEFPKPVGARLLSRCDVPDLDLLPQRFPGVKTVSFHAGFASDTGHRAVERLARLVRDGKLASALPFARLFNTLARWVAPLLSDSGAMFVRLEGLDEDGKPQTMTWRLLAHDNHGPNIPCAPSIALASKIAAGNGPAAGATPCLGLLTVEEILEPLKPFSIREFPA